MDCDAARVRARRKDPEVRKRDVESNKAWRANNPDKVKRLEDARYARGRSPEQMLKHKARCKVYWAIKRGDLTPVAKCSCADCGVPATEYHHEDYTKPLEVIPLCKSCHVARHTSLVTLD